MGKDNGPVWLARCEEKNNFQRFHTTIQCGIEPFQDRDNQNKRMETDFGDQQVDLREGNQSTKYEQSNRQLLTNKKFTKTP